MLSSSIPMHNSSSSSIAIAKEQSIITPMKNPSSIRTIPKKPQRPLTAYHIFFQIEREYVIQTMDGDVADQNTMENKILHDDVPQRYKNIKLMPDWYAGPGKRKKRKHRKQHGKIGFLELSKIISSRWAELDKVDPETKSFVQKIAKSEVAEYYKEMNEYKELIKDLPPSLLPPNKKTNKKRTQEREQGSSKKMKTCHPQVVQQEKENTPLTSIPIIATPIMNKRVMMPTRQARRRSIIEAYDSFKNDQPLNIDDVICQPIDMTNVEPPPLRRMISNGSSCGSSSCPEDDGLNSPSSVEVDLCDDEILQLWATSWNSVSQPL